MQPRLFLVEFLNRDRFCQYRSDRFPFVAGWARARGLAVRWLAFGFDPATLPTSRFRMALPPAEEAALGAALRDFAPTHVLTNEELDAPLEAVVTAAAPAGATLAVQDLGQDLAFERSAHLAGWLGLEAAARALPEDAPWLLDDAEPDYRCELVGPLAHEIRPLTFLVGGPHCLYARPLARNPRYAGVDLTGTYSAIGCAFCGEVAQRRYLLRTPPVALALKQLRAALATLPPGRAGGGFALWGAAAVMRLHEFFDAVLAERLPPVSLFVALRVDELLRAADRIEARLPRLAAAGHALDLYNMGVENFSPAENERLNKGIDAAQVARAQARLARWERDWPETLRFTRHGGFGFILFTPWTTTDDVAFNLEQAERLGVGPKQFFLTSRLQLLPGRAITRLAETDGLTADRAAGGGLGGFDSGCIMTADGYELPWRFRHPEVGALYAVLRRLWPRADVPPDDALWRRVRGLVSGLPAGWREPLRLARELLAVATAEPRPGGPEALAERFAARIPALLAGARPPAAPDAVPADAAPADDALRARLVGWTRALLRRLDEAPQRPLLGFRPRAVGAVEDPPGWGALTVTLRRGDEELRLTVVPRERLPQGRWGGARFAVSHDPATPPDTPDRRRALETFARAFERWMATHEPAASP
jgi:hypothetical protein